MERRETLGDRVGTLLLPNENIHIERNVGTVTLEQVEHNIGRVPLYEAVEAVEASIGDLKLPGPEGIPEMQVGNLFLPPAQERFVGDISFPETIPEQRIGQVGLDEAPEAFVGNVAFAQLPDIVTKPGTPRIVGDLSNVSISYQRRLRPSDSFHSAVTLYTAYISAIVSIEWDAPETAPLIPTQETLYYQRERESSPSFTRASVRSQDLVLHVVIIDGGWAGLEIDRYSDQELTDLIRTGWYRFVDSSAFQNPNERLRSISSQRGEQYSFWVTASDPTGEVSQVSMSDTLIRQFRFGEISSNFITSLIGSVSLPHTPEHMERQIGSLELTSTGTPTERRIGSISLEPPQEIQVGRVTLPLT